MASSKFDILIRIPLIYLFFLQCTFSISLAIFNQSSFLLLFASRFFDTNSLMFLRLILSLYLLLTIVIKGPLFNITLVRNIDKVFGFQFINCIVVLLVLWDYINYILFFIISLGFYSLFPFAWIGYLFCVFLVIKKLRKGGFSSYWV